MRAPLLRGLGWFILANALLFKIITLVLWSGVISPPQDAVATAYRWLAHTVHWPMLAALLLGAPLALLILLLPRKGWAAGAAALFGAAATFLILTDALVYAQYRMHLGGYVWGLLLGGSGKETFIFSATMWALIGLIAGAACLVQALLYLLSCRLAAALEGRRLGRAVFLNWVLAFIGLNLWHAWADAHYEVRISRENGHLPFYQPLTAKRSLRSWGLVALEQPPVEVPAAAAAGLRYPLEPLQCAAAPRANVLLIVIDAWRADQLGAEATPHISRFSEEALRFQRHVSGSNATRFGLFSIFYSLPGNYWFPMLRTQTPPVLMQEVVRHGYDLAILGSAPLVHPEFNITVFSGIDGLRLRTPGDRPVERDRRVTADMVDFLRDPARGNKPFFGFLWLNSVHSYDFPEEMPKPYEPSWEQINYLALGPDFDRTPYFNRYRNALRFVDGEVGKVLEALRASGELDDTLVIITGDHGEEFNDSGKNYWGHNGNFSPWQVQVPLVVRWPSWGKGAVDYMTSHYDLAPTVLTEVFGCRNDVATYGIGLPLRRTEGRRQFVPVADYNDTGIYEPDRITLFSKFGGLRTYSPDYTELDLEPRPDVVRAVTEDMLRFSGRPAAQPTALP